MEPCLAQYAENGMLVITRQDMARRHYKALHTAPKPSYVKTGRRKTGATGSTGRIMNHMAWTCTFQYHKQPTLRRGNQ